MIRILDTAGNELVEQTPGSATYARLFSFLERIECGELIGINGERFIVRSRAYAADMSAITIDGHTEVSGQQSISLVVARYRTRKPVAINLTTTGMVL